ncbi:hypothetical protein V8C42DRAFT_64805 [Trichoderma barbatum]
MENSGFRQALLWSLMSTVFGAMCLQNRGHDTPFLGVSKPSPLNHPPPFNSPDSVTTETLTVLKPPGFQIPTTPRTQEDASFQYLWTHPRPSLHLIPEIDGSLYFS